VTGITGAVFSGSVYDTKHEFKTVNGIPGRGESRLVHQ
jgi:hypothetical protein